MTRVRRLRSPSSLVLPVALFAIALVGFAPTLPGQDDEEKKTVPQRYHELAGAGDHAGLVSLWDGAREAIIPTIDADLEKSLALWEKHGDARRSEIEGLVARALTGARAATEATGSRRILDYVTSFAGWNDGQKKDFRAGQAAYRQGREAMTLGEYEKALTKGMECRSLAEPLGDWWGTGMGLHLEGMALLELERREDAVIALSRARLVYRELYLTVSALRIELVLAPLLLELDRVPRATAMIHDGLATAQRLGITPLVPQFEKLREALGSSGEAKEESAEKEPTSRPRD